MAIRNYSVNFYIDSGRQAVVSSSLGVILVILSHMFWKLT
jgi:hypothetical protein